MNKKKKRVFLTSVMVLLTFAFTITTSLSLFASDVNIDSRDNTQVEDTPAEGAQTPTTNDNQQTTPQPASAYHTVRFVDGLTGAQIGEEQQVPAGEDAVAPEPAPHHEGYQFTGWDTPFTAVDKDLTVTAQYAPIAALTLTIHYTLAGEDAPFAQHSEGIVTGQRIEKSIESPVRPGFYPDQPVVNILVESVTESIVIQVTYLPENSISYKVQHWLQDANVLSQYIVDPEKTQTLSGSTGSAVTAQPLTISGFTALTDELQPVEIAADGSTVLVVKYNRNRSILTFNTGEDASLVAPYEALYGTPVDTQQIGKPSRTGAAFLGWEPALPETMPAENAVFTAQWLEDDEAAYTVEAYLQNPNSPDDYTNFIGRIEQTGAVGEVPAFDLENLTPRFNFPTIGRYTIQNSWKSYYVYNTDKSAAENDGRVVKANGKTVYKIYYDRASYTFKMTFSDKVLPPILGMTDPLQYDDSYRIAHNGVEYKNGEYTFTARYGQSLAGLWPSTFKPYSLTPPSLAFEGYTGVASGLGFGGVPGAVSATFIGPKATPGQVLEMRATPAYPDDFYTVVSATSDNFLELLEEPGQYPAAANFKRNLNARVIKGTKGSIWYTISPYAGFTAQERSVRLTYDLTDPENPLVSGDAVHWKRATYSLTLKNTSNPINTFPVAYTRVLEGVLQQNGYTPLPPADKANHAFKGWYSAPDLADNKQVNLATLTMSNSPMTLYAKWAPGKNTITFTPGNTTDPPFTQEQYAGKPISKPTAAYTKEGYTFGYWRQVGRNVPFNFNDPISGDIQLEIYWIPKTNIYYTIYYIDRASNKPIAETEQRSDGVVGATLTLKPVLVSGYLPEVSSSSITISGIQQNAIRFYYNPVRTVEYTVRFINDSNGKKIEPDKKFTTEQTSVTINGNSWNFAGFVALDGDVLFPLSSNAADNIITLRYRPVESSNYTVRHLQQNTSGDGYTEVMADREVISAAVASMARATAKTTYNGFTYNSRLSVIARPVQAGNKTELTVYYDRNLHTVDFTTDGNGTLRGETSFSGLLYGSLFGDGITPPVPQGSDGYSFDKWEPALPENNAPVLQDITYTAQFKQNPAYTVEHWFEEVDGTFTLHASEVLHTVSEGETASASPIETLPDGLRFHPESSTTSATVTADGQTKLLLRYTRKLLSVTFTAGDNGILQNASSFDSIRFGALFGKAVTVPTPAPNPGYQFEKWTPALPQNTDAVTNSAAYNATFSRDDAQWLVVSFHANGGNGSMNNSREMVHGSSYTIPQNRFARDGYRFTGWNSAADGSGTSYDAKATFTPTGSTTLYAQWEALPAPPASSVPPASSSVPPASSSTPPASASNTPPAPPASTSTPPASSTARSSSTVSSAPGSSAPTSSQMASSTPAASSGGTNAAGAASTANGSSSNTTAVTEREAARARQQVENHETLQQIKDEGVPVLTFGDNEVPLFGANKVVWSLLNLIVTVASVAGSLLLCFSWVVTRKKDKDNGTRRRNNPVFRIVAIVVGGASLLAFLLTQDLRALLVLADAWTPLFLAFAAAQILFALLGKFKQRDEQQQI